MGKKRGIGRRGNGEEEGEEKKGDREGMGRGRASGILPSESLISVSGLELSEPLQYLLTMSLF